MNEIIHGLSSLHLH